MAITEQNTEIVEAINRAHTISSSAPKAIKQHKTNKTAKFIADKMKLAGDTLVGRTYKIEDFHNRFLTVEGVEGQQLSGVQAFVAGTRDKSGVLTTMIREAKKTKYWSHQWRAAIIEKDYEDEFEKELKKGPNEGFVLLHPKNPFDVGGHERQLADWYDPVLQKRYDEVDWAKNADGFIPELKTSIEVKTTTSTTAVQNKGLNTENLQRYDGLVGYAKVVVSERKTVKGVGMSEQRMNSVATNLANSFNFWGNQSKAQLNYNIRQWKKFQEGKTDFVYDVKVDTTFTSMYRIETIAGVIRAKLQKLGLESGKPMPQAFLDKVSVKRINLVEVLTNWLNNAKQDHDFFGIMYVESDLRPATKALIEAQIRMAKKTTPSGDPEEILIKALIFFLKKRKNAELFMEVARDTGKIHWSPQIQMGANYEKEYAIKEFGQVPLGGSEFRPLT